MVCLLQHTLTPLLNTILNNEKKPGRKTGSTPPSSIWNNSPKTTAKPFGTPALPNNNNNPTFNNFDNRQSSTPIVGSSSNTDLRVSSSQDSRRTQNEAVFENDVKPTVKSTPKPPSLDIEPPFFNSIPSGNNVPSGTTNPAPPSHFRPTPSHFVPPATTTTTISPTIASRFNGPTPQTTQTNAIPTIGSTKEDRPRYRPNTIASFGDKLHTTTVPTNKLDGGDNNEGLVPVIPDSNKYPEPPAVLLPPYETSNTIASATTQGNEGFLV